MLISILAIAGGSLYVGIKVYAGFKAPKKPARRFAFLDRARDGATHRSVSWDLGARTNYYLILSSAAVGLSLVAALGAPLFSLISSGLTLYTAIPLGHMAYQSLRTQRKIGIAVYDVTITVVAILAGSVWAAAMTPFSYYLSRKLLMRTEGRFKTHLQHMVGSQTHFVRIVQEDGQVRMPLEALQVDDIVVVHAGETLPVDGIVTEGVACLDQHVLTGEAQPVETGEGDAVFATSVVLSGRLHIRVEKTGHETLAAHLDQLLRRTADLSQSLQSGGEAWANQVALPVLMAGGVALPIVGADGAAAVLNSCPGYYLRVLAPVGMLNHLNLAAQHGILIKDGRLLELLSKVDTIVFDKTGTLTQANFQVGHISTCNGYAENAVLAYAAAAEYSQPHPIAQAIRHAATIRGLCLPDTHDAAYEVGYGITVRCPEQQIRVGSARFMEMQGLVIPAAMRQVMQRHHDQGETLVMVALDDHLGGVIALRAVVRPEAKRVMRRLQQWHLSLHIVSGDHAVPTQQLAADLGIDHCVAEALPEHKAEVIAQLQRQGKSVCFVGEGINDALALQQADVSVSLSGAATLATDTAQIILMEQSLSQLCDVFDLGQAFDRNVKRSFLATIVPGILSMAGTLFLGTGLTTSMLLNQLGLWVGAANSMVPRFQRPSILRQGAAMQPTGDSVNHVAWC
ncbi:Potassium-transporting ATPase ATP-binding subunit [Candidatus Entotheonellaceae bacterium PAL068K]